MEKLYQYKNLTAVDRNFLEEQHYINLFAKYLEKHKASDANIFIKKIDFLAEHKLDENDRIYKFFIDE